MFSWMAGSSPAKTPGTEHAYERTNRHRYKSQSHACDRGDGSGIHVRLDLRVDWLSVHTRDEAEEIVFGRIRDRDHHIHASRDVRHRESDNGLLIRVRQVAEAIGNLDRRRRQSEVL